MNIFKRFFLILFLGSFGSVYAMVFDNRYFPLYPHMFMRTWQRPSVVAPDAFFMVANDAAQDNDDSVGVPEILGKYDLNNLAMAIGELPGRQNPFINTEFEQYIGRNIPYRMTGKLQAQGAALAYYQQITNNIGVGANCFVMHAFSNINFDLDNNTLGLTPEQELNLDSLRRCMQESIGLAAPKFSKTGFSDMDVYLRLSNMWTYKRKLRRIDAGLRIGALIPTGVKRDVNNPASVPFGGNGHWGAYVAGDLQLELREDWIVGCLLRMSKRAEKTQPFRLTLDGEQPLFGALFGDAFVDPGLTFIACPYFRVEDIRDGLGIQAKYTIVHHFDDLISDARFGAKDPEAKLGPVNEVSDWTSEYLTLNVFYDFSRVRTDKWYAPVFSFMWDIPIQFFLTERFVKTHRVSVGAQFYF